MSYSAVMVRRISIFAVSLMVLGIIGLVGPKTSPASSAPASNSLSVYMDSPFVQGSYVAANANPNSGVSWMNFNGTTGLGRCGDNAPTGVSITGTCSIDSVAGHGGATPEANNGNPTVGGSGSNFPTTVSGSTITINLTQESRYLGLWWSAGSATNTIRFYKDNTLLITMTTSSITSLLGSNPANNAEWLSRNNDQASNVITSINGTTKNRKVWYNGNPRGYDSSTDPTAISTIPGYEPFVYIHLFAQGNLSFNKVELSGAGFEFDNLALSTSAQTPDPRLVLVSTININSGLFIAQFDGNGSGVQGTMENQVAGTSTALRSNTFSRAGYTFTGWNTQANGQGTSYSNQQQYPFSSDVTLYAQWQPLSYVISYDSQGGSAVAGGSYATGSTVTLPPAPSRTGYTFTGWFTSPTGGTALGTSYAPPATGNITLYAQWREGTSELAATGANTANVLGAFGVLTAGGLLLFAQSLRLRREQK